MSTDSGSVIEIDKERSRKEGESMEIIEIGGIKSGGGGISDVRGVGMADRDVVEGRRNDVKGDEGEGMEKDGLKGIMKDCLHNVDGMLVEPGESL